jgi:two-component system, sensor histidine kinase LadS
MFSPILKILLLVLFVNIAIFSNELESNIGLLRDSKTKYLLGKTLQILSTNDSSLRLSKVRKSNSFTESKTEIPNFGFSDKIYWVKLQIKNESEINEWYLHINYPLLESIEFFSLNENGKWMKTKTGSGLPLKSQSVLERSFNFPIQLEKDKLYTYYFRFQSNGVLQFPIQAYSNEKFLEKQAKENFITGIYYGIFSVLVIYNLILFFILRNMGYLYYLLFIISGAIAQSILSGIAIQHFSLETPLILVKIIPIMTFLTLFFGLLFTRNYLETARNNSTLDATLVALMGIAILLMLSGFIISYQTMLYFLSIFILIFSVSVLFIASVCLDNGFKPAIYYILAWAVFIMGIGFYSFDGFGIFRDSLISEFGLQIGSTLEMCILSLGLAYKIKLGNLHQTKFFDD